MSDLEVFTLDPGNRAAAAAARAVADASAVPFAPLVLVGPKGSGKTALLTAIAERLKANHPRATIELLDPATLAERYRSAELAGEGEAYRGALAAVDLLLLDDLDQAAGHREWQGLLADLLAARRAAGREIVTALSLPVEKLEGLDARVIRRLAEGTTVRLSLPGPEARVAILRRRMATLPTGLPDAVVRAVAATAFPSLRDYTGALSRLVAFQEASPVPLSPEDALLLIGAPQHSSIAGSGESVSRYVGKSVASAPPPTDLPTYRPTDVDEFGEFLSDVTAGVSEQVDRWRRRIGEAVLYWAGEGFTTRRLEELLEREDAVDPGAVLEAYESDAREIRGLGLEAAALAPDLAGASLFRDPDQVAAARALVAAARSGSAPLSAPLPQYRWEDLAEGPASRLVMLAGRDIIAEPGQRYSPLLVVGASGTGKSHLLHALGNALAGRGIGPIACLGSPAFAAEVRGLTDAESLANWRHRYRWVGALLLDDLHLLAEDRRAQQELALIVAELLEGQRQMVFASARPLEDLASLDPRLASRLHGGLLVELPPPDRELRLAIVKRMLAGTPAGQDAALADYLAGRHADSVREVQSLVQRVLSTAAAQRLVPSPALAREVLEAMPLGSAGILRRSGGQRASGIVSPGVGMVRSREKLINQWPQLADRLIAELR